MPMPQSSLAEAFLPSRCVEQNAPDISRGRRRHANNRQRSSKQKTGRKPNDEYVTPSRMASLAPPPCELTALLSRRPKPSRVRTADQAIGRRRSPRPAVRQKAVREGREHHRRADDLSRRRRNVRERMAAGAADVILDRALAGVGRRKKGVMSQDRRQRRDGELRLRQLMVPAGSRRSTPGRLSAWQRRSPSPRPAPAPTCSRLWTIAGHARSTSPGCPSAAAAWCPTCSPATSTPRWSIRRCSLPDLQIPARRAPSSTLAPPCPPNLTARAGSRSTTSTRRKSRQLVQKALSALLRRAAFHAQPTATRSAKLIADLYEMPAEIAALETDENTIMKLETDGSMSAPSVHGRRCSWQLSMHTASGMKDLAPPAESGLDAVQAGADQNPEAVLRWRTASQVKLARIAIAIWRSSRCGRSCRRRGIVNPRLLPVRPPTRSSTLGEARSSAPASATISWSPREGDFAGRLRLRSPCSFGALIGYLIAENRC